LNPYDSLKSGVRILRRLKRLSDASRRTARGLYQCWLPITLVLALPFAVRADRVQIAQIEITPEMLGFTADRVQTPVPVWDLSFSPDGSMLAIGAGMYLRDGYSSSIVLIVSVAQPELVLYRFEVWRAAISYEDAPGDLLWLPDSDGLIVSNRRILIDLRSASQDWLEHWGETYEGMLQSRRMITSAGYRRENLIRYSVRSATGELLSTWFVPWLPSISAVPSKRDAAALCRWRTGPDGPHDYYCETQLIDILGRPFTLAWEDRSVPIRLSLAQFGGEERLLCGGKYRGYRRPVVFSCWNVETGDQTVQLDDLGMWPSSPFSVGGTRVAMDDFNISVCPACEARDHGPLNAVFRRRVIWDFATNQQLAAWDPDMQAVQETWERTPRQIRYRFSLSPDGRYLAEGGAGTVRIYDIVPDSN
jgi:hypothetical protein